MIKHFFIGFHYLIDGFRLISKPGLKRFVIIPLTINILLFASLFLLLQHYMHAFNAWLLSYLPAWLQWLGLLLWWIFFFGFFIVSIYLFVTVANIISAPFNSLLAEKVEMYLTSHLPEQRSVLANVKDTPRIIGRQLAILGYYLPRALFILILFLIPILHILAVIVWFLFNAWYMTFTYIDYPTDNHRIPLLRVRQWLNEKRWMALGFGMSILLCSMIPVLNFFVIPAAVAGATKWWVDAETKQIA